MTETTIAPTETDRGDALAERLFLAGLGALELLTVELGTRLGLYDALAKSGGATTPELAATARISERYAREWLEQQASAGIIDVDDASAAANARRYSVPDAHDDVLRDPLSLRYSASIPGFLVGISAVLDELADAYRRGDGVAYDRYGAALRDSQGAFNRPLYSHVLAGEWLPNALPELHARLSGEAPSRVADLGCGIGWSTVAIARAYPHCRVDGIDSDTSSIERAREIASGEALGGRVQFRLHDAAVGEAEPGYDAVFIFEALHDMAQPVAALDAARRMLGERGVCVVMDEKVADEFVAPGDEVERFMFAASVLHCLPAGMAEQPSAGTGTMLRRPVIERYAKEAGFAAVTDLDVEHDFFRLYRLDP